ncbi:MAG: PqiC family protein [Proteobacteria bacterium]|nr:PqiC family protein [Pseudomonadota bacterium]
MSPLPRRQWLALLGATALALLTGCVSGPALPPAQWVRLPAMPAAPLPAPAQASADVWQLVLPLDVPGYLERDALLVPQGAAGLQPLAGVRWAEPLRDAVPRLLRQDLATLLGTTVWVNPLPPGVQPTRQLRIELLQLDVAPGRSGVTLHARWSVADPQGRTPARSGEARISQPATATDADALVLAHRAALARLAEAIAS